MKDRYIDLTGKTFGRLLVLKKTTKRTNNRHIIYKCKCECGKTIYVSSKGLLHNGTKSCGCLQKEKASENFKKSDAGHMSCYKETKIQLLNETLYETNSSGVRGVCFDKRSQKFVAYIYCQGKQHYLGLYETLEKAKEARKIAEEELWKPIIEEYKDNEKGDYSYEILKAD